MGKKKKALTAREKAERAAIRKELQEKGVLPPDKPRLNRKKFVEEASAEWDARAKDTYLWDMYLMRAVGWMLADVDISRAGTLRKSENAVAAAKLLRVALALERLYREAKGTDGKVTVGDEYQAVEPILHA